MGSRELVGRVLGWHHRQVLVWRGLGWRVLGWHHRQILVWRGIGGWVLGWHHRQVLAWRVLGWQVLGWDRRQVLGWPGALQFHGTIVNDGGSIDESGEGEEDDDIFGEHFGRDVDSQENKDEWS